MSSGYGDSGGTPDTSAAHEMDHIEVYLRLKPVAARESEVVEIENERAVIVNRHLPSKTAIRYTFEHIFPAQSDQAEVFGRIAKPCVQDVLSGKPALMFMYGFTGSGKTYTMSGTPQSAGILPRAMDLLFNSVPSHLKAIKSLFKPDGLNGYDINTAPDVEPERQSAMLTSRAAASQSLDRAAATKKLRNEHKEWLQRARDSSRVPDDIGEDCRVAVFVQYIEIYNDRIYDLLEESPSGVQGSARGPSVRILRGNETKYVFGAVEVEVETADEAIEVWLRGQSRKRVASTSMNAESSRGHSVFIVKVVQAPIDKLLGGVVEKKEYISVTQLSLVDLAGCEQQKKTGASGDRLKEANNINQSLTVLRKCLEYLRENQVNPNVNRNIPYRECKLTHLFKSFFDGRGRVKMVVCISPRVEDCAQTLEVLKFAESAQDIELHRVQQPRTNPYIEPTPVPSLDDARTEIPSKPAHISVGNLSRHVPSGDNHDGGVNASDSNAIGDTNDTDIRHQEDDDEIALAVIMRQLKEAAKEFKSTKAARDEASRIVSESTREWDNERRKLKSTVAGSAKDCKRQAKIIRSQNEEMNRLHSEIRSLKEKLIESESKKECAEKRTLWLDEAFRKAKNEQIRIKKDMEAKYAKKKDLLVAKYHQMLREQTNEALLEGRTRGKKDLIMDLLQKDEFKHLDFTAPDCSSGIAKTRSPKKPQPLTENAKNVRTNEMHQTAAGTGSNKAAKVSSSSEANLSDTERPTTKSNDHCPDLRSQQKKDDACWLEHTDGIDSTQRGAIVQLHVQRKKSVTRLERRDLESADKYALVTSDGPNIQVVKGEVLTSASGGASVVFTDVEVLRKEKIAGTSKRKTTNGGRGHGGSTDTKKRCGVAIEGHPYMTKIVLRDSDGNIV